MEPLPRHIWSISRAAAQLRITVEQLRKLANEMQIESDFVIDDVHYYGIGSLNAMRSRLAEAATRKD